MAQVRTQAECKALLEAARRQIGQLARADGVRHQGYLPADVPPHRHPRNAVVMPKSRDFR